MALKYAKEIDEDLPKLIEELKESLVTEEMTEDEKNKKFEDVDAQIAVLLPPREELNTLLEMSVASGITIEEQIAKLTDMFGKMFK